MSSEESRSTTSSSPASSSSSSSYSTPSSSSSSSLSSSHSFPRSPTPASISPSSHLSQQPFPVDNSARVVTRCYLFNNDVNVIRSLLADCSRFKEWWPKEYIFEVKSCPLSALGETKTEALEAEAATQAETHVRFQSWLGAYSSYMDELTPRSILIRYGDGILSGFTRWSFRAVDERRTELCFQAQMIPQTASSKMAMSVASDDYAASFFEPMIDSLHEELDRRDFHAMTAFQKKVSLGIPQQEEEAKIGAASSHLLHHQRHIEDGSIKKE